MSSSAVLGKFLWHELLTPDPAAGGGFYSKVFGWNASPWEGSADYTMLTHAKGPVGGARIIGKDSLADHLGPSWLTYVGVPELSVALAAAEARGAKVIHPVTGIAGGGHYAVITDPQGAAIGLYEPGAGMADGDSSAMAGPVEWHELTVADPVAALEFYKAIVGWDVVATHQMGGDVGTYYLFGKGTTQMGGAWSPGAGQPSRWLCYMKVPGVVASAAAIVAAGGKLLNGPHEVPGGGWIAQVLDSHGVPMAIHGPKEIAKPKAKAVAKPKPAAKPAAVAVAPKVTAKVKVKAKAKPKAKTKLKTKTKTKTKAKTKAVVKAKRTPPKPKLKVKAKAKGAAKAKKSKTKAKAKAPSKARKAPRKGK